MTALLGMTCVYTSPSALDLHHPTEDSFPHWIVWYTTLITLFFFASMIKFTLSDSHYCIFPAKSTFGATYPPTLSAATYMGYAKVRKKTIAQTRVPIFYQGTFWLHPQLNFWSYMKTLLYMLE